MVDVVGVGGIRDPDETDDVLHTFVTVGTYEAIAGKLDITRPSSPAPDIAP
jgi:hypothetical protein